MLDPVNRKSPCACCGYLTLSTSTRDSYEICPICYWEDDQIQNADPSYAGGANGSSLKQAQVNFKSYGACDLAARLHVRPPTAKDARADGWRPL